MLGDAESELVVADMRAFEFHEAAWGARDGHGRPPDPTALSDRVLSIVMRYGEGDLPPEATAAVDTECRRRCIVPTKWERLLGGGTMALLALSGFLIMWELLLP